MAFIHTNFLTGNDSTGDGSTGTPYKTVFKALGVAASSDFIKVAGGQWSSALAGTFTFTYDSNVVTTSVSQVGTVLVDDILSFEDGQFGFDRFHVKVLAVTAGNITTQLFWGLDTVTVSDVKRIQTYHYTTTGTTTFETQTSTNINPGGRTGITVSGGWSNDFTTQGGWTVVRRTAQPITGAPGPALFTPNFSLYGALGAWNENLIFDKFLFENAIMWAVTGATSTVTTNSSFALGEIAFVRGRFSGNSQSGGFGIFQNNPAVPVKIYNTCSNGQLFLEACNANGNANRPEATKFEMWNTASSNTANNATTNDWGFGMLSSGGLDGSINQITLHYRSNYFTSGTSTNGSINSNSWGNSGGYYDAVNFYCNRPTFFNILVGVGVFQFDDINLLGAYANQSTLTLSPTGTTSGVNYQIITNTTSTIDSIKPGFTARGVLEGASATGAFNRITQGPPSIVTVVDSEGLKTMDLYNNVYFKDNGNLKVGSSYSFSTNSSPYDVPKLIGVFEKPLVEFTVSFTLKVDAGAEGKWTKLLIQYGPNVNQVIEQALTPTDTFATYTMTVDPADYGDWTKFQFPIYLGIQARSANAYLSEAMTYCYIQSVTIV
jgi:hypothetical protein